MSLSLDNHSKVASEFLRAAVGAGSWQRAVDGVADLTHSTRAQLIGANKANKIAFIWGAEYSKEAYKEYLAINADNPRINPRWWATDNFRELEVTGDNEYETIHDSLLNGSYLDYSRKWDMPYGCQTTLSNANDFRTALLSLRSKADGRADENAYNAMARIAPHAAAAINLARNLDSQQQSFLTQTLEGLNAAAIVCDFKLRIMSINEGAEKLFIGNQYLKLENGQLSAFWPNEKAKLHNAVTRLINGASEETVALGNNEGGSNYLVLDMHILPAMENSLFYTPRIIITPRKRSVPFGAQLLNEIFDLTDAEAEIARDLAVGKSREEIAALRKVKLETVRSQIKSIFYKTGVRRETELVAKISSCKMIG